MSLLYAEADPSTVCLCFRHKTNCLWGNSAPGKPPISNCPAKRSVPNDGKRTDTIGLSKKEARSPKNAAPGGAIESAGASNDCVTAGENDSPIHIDRAPNRNYESQDKRIATGSG